MDQKKIVVLYFLAAILLGIIFIPGALRYQRLLRQNRELEKQIADIQQLNRQLQEEQEKLINDPIYLENVAREKLGAARKGEVVYKVVPSQQGQ